jgi:tripartite-type tricarboxylate transporter receptor subunit TctC
MVQVPYGGAGPVISDLISGHIPMGVVAVTDQALEFHRSGKLRILAVTSSNRLFVAPQLPTAAEAGMPGLVVKNSIGLLAPARTRNAIVNQIAKATRVILGDQAFQQMLIELGFEPILDSNPVDFGRSLEADLALWEPVVKALNLQID